jgi:hypothetical protein
MPLFEDVDLIILATVSPRADLVPALIDLLPSSQIGKPLVLIISEHLSAPEADDRITFLDFPFDMDTPPFKNPGQIFFHRTLSQEKGA